MLYSGLEFVYVAIFYSCSLIFTQAGGASKPELKSDNQDNTQTVSNRDSHIEFIDAFDRHAEVSSRGMMNEYSLPTISRS